MVDKQNIKILVVDDDSFVRDMLSLILQSSDYMVETAENGAEALEKYHSGSGIDLIISDINMPKMTGLELIKKLREGQAEVPVIVLTGNNEISVAIGAMNSGANDYLLKDENIQDTLVLSVEKVWEKHQLKEQNLQLMADLAAKNEKLEKERALAQKVQINILPRFLNFRGLEIETFYRPSDKIGGDFFDAWETEKGFVHFLIGDVSGHSTSSAMIMAVAKGMLQSLGYAMHEPLEIIKTANRMLCEILNDTGMFLSLVYGIFEREKNEMLLVSAGHNPVFLLKGKALETIDSTGPVLGWDPNDSWEVLTLEFTPGSHLFLYTDGLTEARNETGEEFGEQRLLRLFEGPENPREFIEKAFEEAASFCSQSFADDLTVFVIKRSENNG